MTVHRCMTPTLLACSICEAVCYFTLQLEVAKAHAYYTHCCIQHIISGHLENLANLLRL